MRNFVKYTVIILTVVQFMTLNSYGQSSNEDLEKAKAAFNKGDYYDARGQYKSILEDLLKSNGAESISYFETYLHLGQYSDGLKEADRYFLFAAFKIKPLGKTQRFQYILPKTKFILFARP